MKPLVLALFGLSLSNDAGFMKTARGADIHWNRVDLPVAVIVSPDADYLYMEEVGLAVKIVNRIIGTKVYADPSPCTLDFVRAWVADGRGMRGTILVQADNVDDKHAGVYPNKYRDGIMVSVLMVLPAEKPTRIDVVLMIVHELGHGLGLDHDGHPGSIMFPRQVPGQTFTRADQMRLRATYGGGQ